MNVQLNATELVEPSTVFKDSTIGHYGVTNILTGCLVVVVNLSLLVSITKSANFRKPSVVFLTQMSIAGTVVGLANFMRGLFIFVDMTDLRVCSGLVALFSAGIGVYVNHMFNLHLDLYMTIHKTATQSVLSKKQTFAMSLFADMYWIILCFAGVNRLKSNIVLYTDMQCVSEIFLISFYIFVHWSYIILLAVMIIVNVMTICLIRKRRKQIQPSPTSSQGNLGQGMNARRLNKQSLIHKTMLTLLLIYATSWSLALAIRITLSQCRSCDSELINTIGNICIMLPYIANGIVSIDKNTKIKELLKSKCCTIRAEGGQTNVQVINVQPDTSKSFCSTYV